MQEKLKQAKNLAEMYREQCIALESELALIREENDAGRELFKVPPVFGSLCEKLFSNLDPKWMSEISPCAGALRQNGQTSAAHDEAVWGTGEEKGHGGRGLQDRPQSPQAEIQRCRKKNLQGTESICLWPTILENNYPY